MEWAEGREEGVNIWGPGAWEWVWALLLGWNCWRPGGYVLCPELLLLYPPDPPAFSPACVSWPVSMAGATHTSLSSYFLLFSHYFFGPQFHVQAAEILLPGLFSVVHLPSQCVHQHAALGLPWANRESLSEESRVTSIGRRDRACPCDERGKSRWELL